MRLAALWLAGYLLLAGGLWGLLWQAQSWALAEINSPAAQQDWQDWTDSVRQRQGDPSYPVRRREPQAGEPPLLVMLRDHFAAAYGGVLLFASVIYGFAYLVFRGVARARREAAAKLTHAGDGTTAA